MKKIFIFFGLILLTSLNAISLNDLKSKLRENHPLNKKIKILKEITKIEKSKILKEIFPQITLTGKSTWQSETMNLPINIPNLPEADKDREDFSFTVNQIIFDAGLNGIKRKISVRKNDLEIQSVNMDLRDWDETLMKLYYGILIQNEKIKIEKLNLKSLEAKEKSAEKAVKFGILTANSVWILQKEILSIQQKIAEDTSKYESLIEEISILTGENLSEEADFILPKIPKNKLIRPEFKMFLSKKKTYSLSSKLNSRAKYPKIAAFAKFDYGKPGLDNFSNEWNNYQIYGLNFKWDVWNWRKFSAEQKILKKKISLVDSDERAFKMSLKMQEKKSQNRINQLKNQINLDKKIMQLNKKILDSATKKFANGDETATNLVMYSNSYFTSKIKMKINEILLNYEKYNLNTNIGEIK